MRHLTLGTATLWPSIGHVAYLLAWFAAGMLLARRTYTKEARHVSTLAVRLTRTRGHLLFERNLLVYRRSWLTIVSGFFEPIFYLFSLGLGLGHYVGAITASRTRATSRRRCSRRRR